ncbi:DUF4144 domain-containing protein [Vibrio maritimus]|uniref:DUF4144 domain-containing protein n=1 Tax=Vibrio maritimus TaxID=990268 RepID=UPI001F3A717A|nr:DUF4144 domain-containing protein [Vibrio maritimus]
MINWPCLLKLEGDDELLYIASEVSLTDELNSLIHSDEDILVDSYGQVYGVTTDSRGIVVLEYKHETLSLEDVTLLVQAHEFSLAQVCLTKIQFNSIAEAIHALHSAQ